MPNPSPSNAAVLNSNFLQLGRKSGGRRQRTVYPRRLPVSCDTQTTLAGIEPTTFRLLVRRTSRANEVTYMSLVIHREHRGTSPVSMWPSDSR